jgi:hypothetical protein
MMLFLSQTPLRVRQQAAAFFSALQQERHGARRPRLETAGFKESITAETLLALLHEILYWRQSVIRRGINVCFNLRWLKAAGAACKIRASSEHKPETRSI